MVGREYLQAVTIDFKLCPGPQGLPVVIHFTGPFQISLPKVQHWRFLLSQNSVPMPQSGLQSSLQFTLNFPIPRPYCHVRLCLFRVPPPYLPYTTSPVLPLSCPQNDISKCRDLNYTVLLKTMSSRMKFKFLSITCIAFHKLASICLSRHFLHSSPFPSSPPPLTL